MLQPHKNTSTTLGSDYRYSFNGMETDHEVSGHGNSYTTQFRQYDPRLGRWKSLDPLAGMFPDVSPFAAFGNNPIYYTDPYGLSPTNGDEGGGTQTSGNGEKKGDVIVGDDGKTYVINADAVTITAPSNTDALVINTGSIKTSSEEPWNIEINGTTLDLIELTNQGGQFSFLDASGNSKLVNIPPITPSEYTEDGEIDFDYWLAFTLGFTNAVMSDVFFAERQTVTDMPVPEGYEDVFYLGEIWGDAASIAAGIFVSGEGASMGAAGIVASSSGVGAIVGVPAIIVGTGLIATGVTITTRAVMAMNVAQANYEDADNSGNFKVIKEKDGNKYAQKAGYKDAHDFKNEWKPSGKNKDWDITYNHRTGQLGLQHKDGTLVTTGAYIKK